MLFIVKPHAQWTLFRRLILYNPNDLNANCIIVGSNLTLANQDQDTSGQLAPEDDAAINLPSSLFRRIANRSTVGLVFALYNDATLFPVGERNTNNARFIQTHVGSRVLAATVGEGLRFNNLGENVTLTLRLFSTEEVYITFKIVCQLHSLT